MMNSDLEVRNLHKRFGADFELSGVDIDVGHNEIVALLGPSGCGKTTTLRCVAGVETPDGGTISIRGDTVFDDGVDAPPEKRDVGMVYQNYAIWPHKTVYENVVFPLKHGNHAIETSEYEDRVDDILDVLEIADLKHDPATDLSGGQQQRTALARSLVYDPDLLLLDEPLSNLDRELRKNMRNQLQRLKHEIGISMLYVTHDQEEAFYLADEVLVMNDGAVVERGRPRELFQRPTSVFTRQFIGDRNRFSGEIAHEGDGPSVRSRFIEFPLDDVAHVADGVDSGSVRWFIRPRDVNIGAFSGDHRGRIDLRGTVVAEGLLGETYELTVEIDDEDALVVHTDDYHEFGWGDDVDLHIKPQDIQVYPAEAPS